MRFYHRTTEDSWAKIQKEGVLFGISKNEGCRHTYLAPDDVGEGFGTVLLEVEYTPVGAGSKIDNYGFDPPPGLICTQFAVFVPIKLSNVRRI